MFVGEAEPVVTVASRTPEAPTTAPAMVTVISREEIVQRGYRTLAELLADQPGFFIASGGRGSVPHLRGLRDSVLFLYDGVPMTTDVTKSFAPLDHEISLFAVARVEIVRGPGSVLWGPDAFAGVVNIVPLRGREHDDVAAGAQAGSDRTLGGHVNLGHAARRWEGFLAVRGLQTEFHDPDFLAWDADDQLFDAEVDPSGYVELVATLTYDKWLNVSARWSDFTRRYTLRNADESIVWGGEKKTPVNQIKVSASKIIGPSHYTLSAYYQETDFQLADSDIERAQRNRVLHAELLWDRRILKRGMLTLGASWRRNAVDGALVRDGFLPEFLPPDVPLFIPNIEQDDFSNSLYSAFGQFRYRLGAGEWWVGARFDDHSQYENTVSYSLGVQYPFGDHLRAKLSYGTAFRSPYSSQLFDDLDFEPESIRTASAQFSWQPGDDHLLELTVYHSRLQDHRAEDPYGGLSEPASRDLYGIELAGQAALTETLQLRGNLSILDDSESDDVWIDEVCFVRPDGSTTCLVDRWSQPAEAGPNWLANLGVHWRLGRQHNLDVSARYGGDLEFSYLTGEVEGEYSQPLLVDLHYRRPGFFPGLDTLSLKVTNLFNRDYRQADTFGPVKGPPLQVLLLWEMVF